MGITNQEEKVLLALVCDLVVVNFFGEVLLEVFWSGVNLFFEENFFSFWFLIHNKHMWRFDFEECGVHSLRIDAKIGVSLISPFKVILRPRLHLLFELIQQSYCLFLIKVELIVLFEVEISECECKSHDNNHCNNEPDCHYFLFWQSQRIFKKVVCKNSHNKW